MLLISCGNVSVSVLARGFGIENFEANIVEKKNKHERRFLCLKSRRPFVRHGFSLTELALINRGLVLTAAEGLEL